MKRIIGIILIFLGVGLAVLALTSHDDDKTIIDLGKVEIKQKDKSPTQGTTLYYVLAAVCMVGGGVLLAGKKV